MKLAIKYVEISVHKTVRNCRWRLQKHVATHYLQSLNVNVDCVLNDMRTVLSEHYEVDWFAKLTQTTAFNYQHLK